MSLYIILGSQLESLQGVISKSMVVCDKVLSMSISQMEWGRGAYTRIAINWYRNIMFPIKTKTASNNMVFTKF